MRTEHDPIDHVRKRLIDEHDADEDELKQIEREIRDIVNEAAQFAQDMPRARPGRVVDRRAGRSLRCLTRLAARDPTAGRDAEERMASEVLMPALSPTMTEGKLARWVKSEGDTVRAGDVIAEIETDKATMEVEAVDEGTLAKILVPEGTEDVAVNTPIALIAGEGEESSTRRDPRRPRTGPAGARRRPARRGEAAAAAARAGAPARAGGRRRPAATGGRAGIGRQDRRR